MEKREACLTTHALRFDWSRSAAHTKGKGTMISSPVLQFHTQEITLLVSVGTLQVLQILLVVRTYQWLG